MPQSGTPFLYLCAIIQRIWRLIVYVYFLTSSTIHPTSLHPQVG